MHGWMVRPMYHGSVGPDVRLRSTLGAAQGGEAWEQKRRNHYNYECDIWFEKGMDGDI